MDHGIHQGQRLALDHRWIACLVRETSGQRGIIGRVGGIQTTNMGAHVRVVGPGEPLQQGGDQRIAEIPTHTPRQRIEARRGGHVLPSDGPQRHRAQRHKHAGHARPHQQHDGHEIPESDIEREMGQVMEGPIGHPYAHRNQQSGVHVVEEPAGEGHKQKEGERARQQHEARLIGWIVQQLLGQLRETKRGPKEHQPKEQAHTRPHAQGEVPEHTKVDNGLARA